MSRIRVLVADDHTIVREGVVALLRSDESVDIVAEAANGVDAVEMALASRPDVAVVDISLPQLNGIEIVRRLAQQLPRTRTLVLTMHNEGEYVLHAVRAGAWGFLLKDSASQDLLKAVRELAAGRKFYGSHAAGVLTEQLLQPNVSFDDPYRDLTDREREVFHLMIEGLTTKEIARKIDVSSKTAENHRGRVLAKLQVRNTAGLIRYAVKHRLLD